MFAVVVVYRLSSEAQSASERRALLAARNLASTVERELSSTTRTLQALASSEQLNQDNLEAFHSEAKRVVPTQPSWITVILLSPDGQQVVNTIQPFGLPLPRAGEPASLQRVVATHQPTIGNLGPSKLKRNLFGFPVRIPVMRGDKLQYVLTAVINQKAIARITDEQATVDEEWTRTVVDGQGVVVARTREPERFVGQRGTPSFLKRIGETTEGVYQDTTLEGMRVYVAFCRVSDSPWTVAVTVPIQVIEEPARRAMELVVSSGIALLFVSGIGAFILSRQISRSITSTASAAEALANGEYPQVDSLSIKEVVLLGQSLEFAANLLFQREQERTENLMRAEAARAEAEAANRIKDEFLAVLSHELRTPLNPILGWSKLLQNGKLDETKTAQALATIERNAKLQSELIEDLLDVSRILQGKLTLNVAPVNLASTIRAAIETIRLAAEAKSIQVESTLISDTGSVLGDATRLQQVMWNLLSNAVKFTPAGGQVKIRLERLDSDACITISDTGQGIAPDFLPYVFDYFRQADGATTRKFGGLGLGLAIVRHLVELHGGTVQADSAGEGQGATFIVRLPLMSTQSQARLEERSSTQNVDLGGIKVLVVDDDADTREFEAFVLEQAGAQVRAVASASEALLVLVQSKPDMLLSDIGMPEINGYMLIQQVRALSPQQGGQIPAIALTAYAGEINEQQALTTGFQKHLSKPVDPEILVQAIASLVRSR
ncbi:response regulator [Leptolyngbya sp. FACHB-17]|nr:response regulator [Leptolyngbya sp. FACHB-17]